MSFWEDMVVVWKMVLEDGLGNFMSHLHCEKGRDTLRRKVL